MREGNRISGLLVQKGSQYVLADNPEITATMGDSLEITLANGAKVVVADFDDGDLGLRLTERAVEVPATGVIDLTYRRRLAHRCHLDRPTTVRGLGGNDYIIVEHVDGNVLIEGGAGGDLVGGTRLETIDSSAVRRRIWSRWSKGCCRENNEPEAAHGRGGNDLVVGGNSNDWLAGGRGDDEIYGGRG